MYSMSPEAVLPLRGGLLQVYELAELAPKKSWYILVV